MRDAYQAVAQLYNYVWDPELFADPKSESKILSLLDRLADDFHKVEDKAPLAAFEPGFTVTLQSQRQALRDVRRRFREGSKDYASWRLRGLSENCIACHSRFDSPTDFIGAPPVSEGSSFDAKFANAQFLFATRQFEEADDALLNLAGTAGAVDSGSADAFRALQLWLVIEVRVKDRPEEAAAELERLIDKLRLADYERQSVKHWIRELKELSNRPSTSVDSLTQARNLLNPAIGAQSVDSDNAHLVKTLKASALLHADLQKLPRSDLRRKATYLLALAYAHMPIQIFEGFRELYLIQTIREFPASDEAQKAFIIYEDLVETENSGSGGLHLDAEQLQNLRELRNLAHGKDNSPPPDPVI